VKSRWKGLANLKIHFPPETGGFPPENRHSNRRQGAGRTARAWRGARPPAKELRARGVAGVGRGAHGRGAVQSAAAGEGIACARGRRCGAQGARLGQQVARGSASVERGRRRRSQAHAGPPEREAAVRGAAGGPWREAWPPTLARLGPPARACEGPPPRSAGAHGVTAAAR